MQLNKQRIIIFEGIDGAGKTTISKTLAKILFIPYFKHEVNGEIFFRKRIPNEILFFAHDRILQLFEQTNYSLIIDRGYPSTFTYNQVYGHRKLDKKELEILRDFDIRSKKLNTKIIICDKEFSNNFRGDEHVNFTDLPLIREQYRIFWEWTRCNCLWLDTTDMDLENQIKKIIKFIWS
jgi:tRNA uridine 5-carbamoylmethylation protein Kti12